MAFTRQLEVVSGPDQGRVLPLQRKENIIGRDAGAHIILSDSEVSRHHCRISIEGQRAEIEDLGSTNGTLVNGRAVEKAWLHIGDSIKLGDSLLELRAANDALPKPAALAGQVTDKIASASKAALLKGWGWESRIVALMVILVTVAVLLTAWPLIRGISDLQRQEARRGASVLVTALALANKQAVNNNEEMSLNVAGVERSPGVLRVLIYDAQGRILAPVSQLHQKPTDEGTLGALAAQELTIRATKTGNLDLAMPIKAFRPGRGEPLKIGTARLIFSTSEATSTSGLLWWRLLASLLVTLTVGFAVGLFIIAFTRRLLLNLRDQCEEALKGSRDKVAPAMVSAPLTALSASINRCLSKMAALKASSGAPPKNGESSLLAGESHPPKAQRESPEWPESGKLVLDDQNIVCRADDGLAAFLGLAGQALEGRHLLHVIQDQELLSRCLGLMELAAKEPGRWHFAQDPESAKSSEGLAAMHQAGEVHLLFETGLQDEGGPLERL